VVALGLLRRRSPTAGPYGPGPPAVAMVAAAAGDDNPYAKFTVSSLRAQLRARGLKAWGTKAELLARLQRADTPPPPPNADEMRRAKAPPPPPATRRLVVPSPFGSRHVTEETIFAGTVPFVRRTSDADFRPEEHLKLITWNVNGLSARSKGPHFAALVAAENPDLLLLQETKLQQRAAAEVAQLPGYVAYDACSEWPLGYSGTRVYVRAGLPGSVHYGLLNGDYNREGRSVTVEAAGVAVVNTYVPNSGEGLRRLAYRTGVWDPAVKEYLQDLQRRNPAVVWAGDLNVAERDYDRFFTGDWDAMQKTAGFSPHERSSFRLLLECTGFTDAFRMLYPTAAHTYTYWSQRARQRPLNNGWRLDYFLVSAALRERVVDCFPLPHVMGSDHCPVALWLRRTDGPADAP
jgi:AP endonuclease-1